MMSMFAQDMLAKGRQDGILIGEKKGRQEGEKKGRQEGEKKGGAKVLTRLLRRRFGNVPTWASKKIAKAGLPALEAWSLQLFDAKTLDELFADPA